MMRVYKYKISNIWTRSASSETSNMCFCDWVRLQVYGEAGKYIPLALQTAFRVFLDLPHDKLPMPTGDSFWLGGPPDMAKALKEFCTFSAMQVCAIDRPLKDQVESLSQTSNIEHRTQQAFEASETCEKQIVAAGAFENMIETNNTCEKLETKSTISEQVLRPQKQHWSQPQKRSQLMKNRRSIIRSIRNNTRSLIRHLRNIRNRSVHVIDQPRSSWHFCRT